MVKGDGVLTTTGRVALDDCNAAEDFILWYGSKVIASLKAL